MKQIVMTFVAMMLLSTAAMAQGNFPQNGQGFDQKEMIKQRTDNTVQKYGLNSEQAEKLLSLNTKYADKIGPGMGGQRGGRNGMRPRPNFGGGNGQGAQQGQRPEMTEEMRQQMEKMRKEREEATKEYEKELQTILTPEQFKSYQADQEEMRKNFGGRRSGGRGPRNANQ